MSDDNKNTDGATGLQAELDKFAGGSAFKFGEHQSSDRQGADRGQQDNNSNDDQSDKQDNSSSKSRLENPNVSLDDFAKDLGQSSKGILDSLKKDEKGGDKKDDDDSDSGNNKEKDDDNKDESNKQGDKKDSKAEESKKSKDKEGKEDEDEESKRVAKEAQDAKEGFKNQRNAENRDVTGFSDQVATWLKRMPVEAYQFFNKQLREKADIEKTSKEQLKVYETKIKTLEEGKQVLPESYYEHPESVVLTQDFKEMQGSLSLAQEVEQHWEQQLIAVSKLKEGEETVVYNLVKDKEGNILVDDKNPIKVTDDNKVDISIALQKHARNSTAQTGAIRGQLTQLVTDYGNKHKEYVGKIAAAEDTYMPWFKDDKSDEYKIFKSVADQLPGKGIPRSNPLFNMLAKSIAMNFMLKDVLSRAGTSNNKQERIKQQQKQGGPTGDDFTGGGNDGGKGPKINSVKQFEGLPPINI